MKLMHVARLVSISSDFVYKNAHLGCQQERLNRPDIKEQKKPF